ncbi:MAG: 5'/3'-nucleotidase SurE [Acidimicrobiaceae bacterium]|nr:5'/3'-nucleotidase SurE [Acidimicrobiaceae bacterium]
MTTDPLATVGAVRILVTNDDGINSVGLHELARALADLGDVTVAAPDSEYSGAGASLGPMHLRRPEVHDAHVDGVEQAWSVSGPPGLCVIYGRLGLFGDPFDLVVAGINPGMNVGRSVYHSGTVGAALTARNGGVTGIAVSQAVTGWGVEGQGADEVLVDQHWSTAATVGRAVAAAVVADMPKTASVVNVNVPNVPLGEVAGWRHTVTGSAPPRSLTTAEMVPKEGHMGSYEVRVHWGEPGDLPEDSDGGAVMAGHVSLTWLNRLHDDAPPDDDPAAAGLADLLG